MKVIDVISYVDKVCHNQIDQNVKIKYLEALDQQIKRALFDTHEDAPDISIQEYTESTELLVSEVFAELYYFYLESKIQLLLGQMARYQNMAVLYDAAYAAFAVDYNRTHKPKHDGSALRFT